MDLVSGSGFSRSGAVGALLTAVVLLISACGIELSPGSGTPRIDDIMRELEGYSADAAALWQADSVAIGVVGRDGSVSTAFVGERDDGEPVDDDTRFEVGSLAQTLLSGTTAVLVDRGHLSWDDRVTDHLPSFATADPWVTGQATVADLLAQRSGLPEQVLAEMFALRYPREAIHKALATVRPAGSFRAHYSEESVLPMVAGEIVADQAGVDHWGEAARQMLLRPLGMSRTGTSPELLTDDANFSRGNQWVDGESQPMGVDDLPSTGEGPPGMVSTVADLARWLRLQLGAGGFRGEQVISEQQIQRIRTPMVPLAGDELERAGHGEEHPVVSHGLGWLTQAGPDGRVVHRTGETPGYRSYLGFDPDREVGVVVLVNQGRGAGLARPLGQYAMDLIQGRAPTDRAGLALAAERDASRQVEVVEDPGPDRPLADFAGRYRSPAHGETEVVAADDGLHLRLGPRRVEVRLSRIGGDRFVAEFHTAPDDPNSAVMRYPAEFTVDEATQRPTGLRMFPGTPPFDRIG